MNMLIIKNIYYISNTMLNTLLIHEYYASQFKYLVLYNIPHIHTVTRIVNVNVVITLFQIGTGWNLFWDRIMPMNPW